MAHTATDTSRDKSEFDDWLDKHNLKDVKQIFIEHNMDTLSDLSLQNENLGALLADERFYNKPNIVMTVFAAIQSLDKQKESSKNVYIIASPKENEIMKQLQQHVDELKQLQNESKQIHDAYNDKVISNNNTLNIYKTKCSGELTVITNHVMKYMNQLKELVKHKESYLYQEIGANHRELKQQESKHIEAVNEIDKAIEETLNEYSKAINDAIQHYKTKTVECENIMKTHIQDDIFSHNPEREKKIIHIAENTQKHFTDTHEKMVNYKKFIEQIHSKKSKMISNHLLESSDEDEKKNYEDTNCIYPWTIHINQSLYEEIKNDINALISITVHSKYEHKNTEKAIVSTQKLKNHLQSEKTKKDQLQSQHVRINEMNKSDEKLIERLQWKRDALYKKVNKYQPHFDEKKDENVNIAQYVPLQGHKQKAIFFRNARKFAIDKSRLWHVSRNGTVITSCWDGANDKNTTTCTTVKIQLYPVHSNKSGYNSGIHTWSVKQLNVVGTKLIGITPKRNRNNVNVKFESHLNGLAKESSWKSGETIHIVLDCDECLVSFYKTDRIETKKIKQQKISAKKSYYFVLVTNAFITGSPQFISVDTAMYIDIYENRKTKKYKKRKSLNMNKKGKSKKKHFLSLNKGYLSDGDAEEMKHEYAQINADNASDISTLATASLSPKSVKSDGSTKARNNRNRKYSKQQRSSNRSKSKGAKKVAKQSSKSKYTSSYITSENRWIFGPK